MSEPGERVEPADPVEPAKPPEGGQAAERGGLTVAQLEALLFVAERPLTRAEIARLSGVDDETVAARIEDLAALLGGRGLRLVTNDERIELATAPEAAALVARYVGHEGPRLTPAALETLAIVAYRQPVTRGAVERIRGVDSDYVLRGLLHRRLVVELGRAPSPGRPFLYGTGFEFLERFGLGGLDELPPLDAETALDPGSAFNAELPADADTVTERGADPERP